MKKFYNLRARTGVSCDLIHITPVKHYFSLKYIAVSVCIYCGISPIKILFKQFLLPHQLRPLKEQKSIFFC